MGSCSRKVTAGFLDDLGEIICEILDRACFQFSRRLDVNLVERPQLLDQAQRRLAIFIGHVHSRIRLDKGLVRAHTKNVPVNTQQVNRILVVIAETAVASQKQHAVWMQIDLVRVCCDVVTLLAQEISTGNDRLARCLEIFNGCRQVLQLAKTRANQAAQFEVHDLDAIVFFRELQRVNNVLHQSLWLAVTSQFRQCTVKRVTFDLLHQESVRLNDEDGTIRQRQRRVLHGSEKQHKNDQQQYQVQYLAKAVDATPDGRKQPSQHVCLAHVIVILRSKCDRSCRRGHH